MGVRAIFQLETPWSENEVFDLGYEQGADVMVFTHLDHDPQRLTRYGHDNWTLAPAVYVATVAAPSNFVVTANAPNMGTGYVATEYGYTVTTIDEATGQESLEAGGQTGVTDLTLKGNTVDMTWDAVPGAERYNVYRAGGGVYGFIGTTEHPEFRDDNIAPDFSQSYPRQRTPFADANNKPAVVAFWNQRAAYARTYNKPNGIFASQIGNLFNMNVARPTTAIDAVTFAVAGRRVNAVLHLVPLKNLLVFTTDTIFSVDKAFSPTEITVIPEGYRAACRVRPVVIDDIAMFGTQKGASIRTLGYQFEADGYRGNDLTVFAPHLFLNVTLVDMCWSEFPTSTVSAVMSDGAVRLLTWQQEQQVWGWSKMTTDGVIESCCTVSEGGEDVVYYIVKRGAKRYVEYTASTRWVDVADAVYLDSAVRYVGEPTDTFGGAYHLAGKTIDVLADGAAYQAIQVSAEGGFSLPQAASKVVAGLPFEAWIRTLPLGAEQVKGEPKAIAGAVIHVQRSRGLEVGIGKNLPPGVFEPSSSDDEIFGLMDEIKTRELEELGDPTALFSGELPVDVECNDWRTADVVVRQRYPLPLHVTGITPDYVLGDL